MQDYSLIPGQRPQKPDLLTILDLVACLIGTIASGLIVVIVWKLSESAGSHRTFYGYDLFCFIPTLAGFVAGMIANWSEVRPIRTGWLSSFIISIFGMVALTITAVEGTICIAMAMPLVYPLIALGLFIGRWMVGFRHSRPKIMLSSVPLLCIGGYAVVQYDPGFATKTESTTIIVNAPPEKIWPYLFELDGLPKPDQWIFKTGIAYTLGTTSEGRKIGDLRQCLLTTGVMNEHISAVELNRHLRFEVLNTPPSMKESNPFHEIHPRHETDCFKVHWGEFRLEPMPDGRTKFTGSSTYSYSIYPAWYWGLFTDTVAEQIHVRMMEEIKRRVEVE